MNEVRVKTSTLSLENFNELVESYGFQKTSDGASICAVRENLNMIFDRDNLHLEMFLVLPKVIKYSRAKQISEELTAEGFKSHVSIMVGELGDLFEVLAISHKVIEKTQKVGATPWRVIVLDFDENPHQGKIRNGLERLSEIEKKYLVHDNKLFRK